MAKKRLYKVTFLNQGKIYEIYARRVSQGELWGFVEIGDFVFGEKSAVVIDPNEERLRAEFESVTVSYIPMHAIVRIDAVEKQGTAKIVAMPGKGDDTVVPFQFPGTPPKKGR
jgi:hypothetical protein